MGQRFLWLVGVLATFPKIKNCPLRNHPSLVFSAAWTFCTVRTIETLQLPSELIQVDWNKGDKPAFPTSAFLPQSLGVVLLQLSVLLKLFKSISE